MESRSQRVGANVSTELTCELASSSSQNPLPGGSSLVCLWEEDIPGASLNMREPSQLHVVELKRWLKCRGATTAGKKQDLVKRVCDYITAGLDAKIVDPDGGVHTTRLQAQSTNQVSPIPSVLPSKGWTSNLQQLPPFNYGCLYAHLVTDSKTIAENQRSTTAAATFRAGAMKHKEEGYRLFRDDHVRVVRFRPGCTTDSHCLFRGIVKPSFKTTGSYSTVVALSKISGYIVGAQCNCKAGAGGCCKHVAALLYNILDYIELGLTSIPEDKTCTDTQQQWNRPRNTPDGPVLFSEIQFVHHSYGKRKAEVAVTRLEKYKKYRSSPASVSEERIRQFCTSLESHRNAPLFTAIMRGNDCHPVCVPSPSVGSNSNSVVMTEVPACCSLTIPQLTTVTPSLSPEEGVWSRIMVSQEQAAEIERKTRCQSKSPEWYKERSCRITSSFFGRVCRRLSSTPPDSLVNSIVNQRLYHSMPLSCAWGKDNEDKALSAYKREWHERGHSSLEVTMSGLVINPNHSWLGASPDGVVHDPDSTDDPNGLLEIKCPYEHRDISPFQAASQKGFCCRLEKGKLVLREQHHYYYQVQGQMSICSKKWCDFVVYTNAEISIQRIFFDEIFWTAMISKLKCFYSTAIVPKLVKML